MPKNKIILCLGLFIAVLPKLGFPYSWHIFLEMASGLAIVLLSVLMSIDKRLMLKAKAERRQVRRRAAIGGETSAEVDMSAAEFGRRVSDAVPERRRVVRLGRRASDVVVEPPAEIQAAESDESTPIS